MDEPNFPWILWSIISVLTFIFVVLFKFHSKPVPDRNIQDVRCAKPEVEYLILLEGAINRTKRKPSFGQRARLFLNVLLGRWRHFFTIFLFIAFLVSLPMEYLRLVWKAQSLQQATINSVSSLMRSTFDVPERSVFVCDSMLI